MRGENEKAVLDPNISLDVIIGCSLSFLAIRNKNGSKSQEPRAKRNSSFVSEELKVWIRPENGS